MGRRLATLAVLAIAAASCGGSDDSAVIERQVRAGTPDSTPQATLCTDIEAFALGSHAGDDLNIVVDELARIAAVVGANDALPHLAAMRDALEEGDGMARSLDAAAEILDAAGHTACEIPVFTAMYVSTSFSSCFGRAPIAAGGLAPDGQGCETVRAPAYLPCFDETAGYVPVDCRTGTGVVLRDGEWVAP